MTLALADDCLDGVEAMPDEAEPAEGDAVPSSAALYWAEGPEIAAWAGRGGPERMTVAQARVRRDRHLAAVENGLAITPEAALGLARELTLAIAQATAQSRKAA